MQYTQILGFIFKSIIVGLALAFIIIALRPDLTGIRLSNANNNTVSYKDAVEKAAPAVVNIHASKVFQQRVNPLFQDPIFQRFFGQVEPSPNKRRDSNLGSGVILDTQGYILTNAHVIKDKDDIQVTLYDGRQTKAKIIGIDTDTDLAVLHIPLQGLSTIATGNSDLLKVGDIVLAIGNPYDFGQTVTQGIVSAKGRKRMGITTFEDFIQTDADINPGNSGGALINASGQLVGINTAIISNTGGSQGIGLATPINLAIEVLQQLIVNGRVVRGWLGIEAQILSPDTIRDLELETGGVLVAAVLNNGPADKAGIIPGDIIIEVDGQLVNDPQQAISAISRYTPGTSIKLQIMRGWERINLQARVAERPLFNP